jgi:predicted RNase H-like nuclease (RuvC/YqgF family)
MMIRCCLQRMRESESALRQLIQERNEAEREKWTILRHARDEAERCLAVTTQLTARDAKIDQLQEELAQVKKKQGYLNISHVARLLNGASNIKSNFFSLEIIVRSDSN